jgi:hypothetical protein
VLEEKKNEKMQRAVRKIRFSGENILRQAGRVASLAAVSGNISLGWSLKKIRIECGHCSGVQ